MIRKFGYRLIGIVMCAVLLMGGIFTYDYAREDRKGKMVQAAKTDDIYGQYTESNPLTVIEIVPYIMYAQLGYHIADGGIADLEKIEDESSNGTNQYGVNPRYLFNHEGTKSIEYVEIQIENEDWKPKLYAMYSKEYFKRYSLEVDISEDILKKQAIRKRLEREIKLAKDEEYKKKCELALEKYRYVGDEKTRLDRFNSVEVVYKAVLVSEVNRNPAILDNADLILFTGDAVLGNVNGIRGFLKEEYTSKLKKCPEPKNPVPTAYENQIRGNPFIEEEKLDWSAADHIFRLSSQPESVPVVMNRTNQGVGTGNSLEYKYVNFKYTALDSDNKRKVVVPKQNEESNPGAMGCSNNVFKLFLMLYQKDPYVFENEFYPYIKTINGEGEFILQEGEARRYWNQEMFFDYNLVTGYNRGENYTTYDNVLLPNGFVWNTDCTFFSNFIESKIDISPKSGVSDGCYFSTQNGGDSAYVKFSKDVIDEFGSQSKISPAEALRYLLKKRKQAVQPINKQSLKVLELEPSNDFTINQAKVREYLSDYKGEVDITYMTSAQFNSTETNLAKTYDLIIIGQNTGGLSEKGANDLIYWKTGKDVTATVDDKDVNTNYPGNDITEDKKNQLLAYLGSGRPILIADVLYDLPSTTEGRIQNGSNMRAFLTDAKVSEAKTKNQIVKLSVAELTPYVATNSLRSYLEVFRPTATNINISYTSDTIRATFDISNMEEAGENVTVKATLFAYLQGKNPTAGCWVGAVDINKNGSYTLNARGDIARELETADPSIKYYLVLEQNGNNKISTEYSGMATRTDNTPNTIKVLQIAPTNTTVDLTSTSDEVGASIHSLTKETIHVTKITVKDFENKYTAMPYNSKDITTNQLLGYDVIVFGCSDDYPQISNKNGALSNVIAQMEKKQSVIFTNGVLHPKQTYTDAETTNAYERLRQLAAMQESAYTYPYLNKNKTAGTQSTMYACENDKTNQVAERATAVNIGMVSEYPYKIETTELKQKTIHSKPQNSQQETVHENSFHSIAVANGKGQIHQANLSHVKGYYALTNDDEAGRKQFSVSPNDIQNNYYLYQTGSVWYSGIGANKLSSSNQQEANLFVNTIIAAYYSAPKAPEVFFEDTNKNEDGTDSVFVDADVFSKEVGADKVITFRPYDAQGTPMDTTIYIDRNGTLEKITKVTDKNGNKIETENRRLNSNEHYNVTISSNVLSDPNIKIYVYVSNENGTGMGECHIVRRVEFDLD